MLGGRGAGASTGAARGGCGSGAGVLRRSGFVRSCERERRRGAETSACAFEGVTVREVAAEEMEREDAEAESAVMGETGCSAALPLPFGRGVVGVAVCVEPLEDEDTEESDRAGEGDRAVGRAGSETDGAMPFVEDWEDMVCTRRLRRDESMYCKRTVNVCRINVRSV